jgi:hypothetical protein
VNISPRREISAEWFAPHATTAGCPFRGLCKMHCPVSGPQHAAA